MVLMHVFGSSYWSGTEDNLIVSAYREERMGNMNYNVVKPWFHVHNEIVPKEGSRCTLVEKQLFIVYRIKLI